MERNPQRTYDDIQASEKQLVVDNENASLSVLDQFVIVASDTSVATITLPSVAEAIGKLYTVHAPNGLTNNVTVQDQDDSVEWTDVTLAGNESAVALYSDGRGWFNLDQKDGALA